MSIEDAYHVLFSSALIVFGILLGIVLVRSIIGPRITDRIMCINMIGTMVICCIMIFSVLLDEAYLLDVGMIYAMISFIAVLMMATIFIPRHPTRAKYGKGVYEELLADGLSPEITEGDAAASVKTTAGGSVGQPDEADPQMKDNDTEASLNRERGQKG